MSDRPESRRVERVNRELREVIAQYLVRGFRHPLKGLVTVADISASADLRQAKVHISTMGTEEDMAANLETLNAYAHEVQSHIGKKIRMKFCPKLRFFDDERVKRALHVHELINNLEIPEDEDSEESH